MAVSPVHDSTGTIICKKLKRKIATPEDSKAKYRNAIWEAKRRLVEQRLMNLDHADQTQEESIPDETAIVVHRPKDSPTNDVNTSVGVSSSTMERAQEVQSNLSQKFPSFIKLMLKSHVSGGFWLGLPKNFCAAHLPKQDEIVVLVGENENEYRTRYLVEKTGLSGGWRTFSIAHKLLAGDILVYQLIEPRKLKELGAQIPCVRCRRLRIRLSRRRRNHRPWSRFAPYWNIWLPALRGLKQEWMSMSIGRRRRCRRQDRSRSRRTIAHDRTLWTQPRSLSRSPWCPSPYRNSRRAEHGRAILGLGSEIIYHRGTSHPPRDLSPHPGICRLPRVSNTPHNGVSPPRHITPRRWNHGATDSPTFMFPPDIRHGSPRVIGIRLLFQPRNTIHGSTSSCHRSPCSTNRHHRSLRYPSQPPHS
ncbi:uncharacterized protein LOC121742326 isoform X2 [Salvia splendens]|uniref:uncharacterized protein LOC121742326 isoform X2 n=1 Tax=Salvia splendens TaxID=180675 RepID=UPI001C2540C3|nr:uncharacterized protein LOC121742326 isoform X2 [Salvia splendens]